MIVHAQDGVYTAVRHAHTVLKVTADTEDALRRLALFVFNERVIEVSTGVLLIADSLFLDFLAAHVQDIQYDTFPVPEQMFD